MRLEEEYEELLAQQNQSEWTSEKEDRLIHIDDLLERHHHNGTISSLFKNQAHIQKVVELIEVTKCLLKEVENDAPNS